MRKRDELTDPNSCMSRARDDELTFVLLARDAAAPTAVRAWIDARIRIGKNRPDDPQIAEARRWAEAVEAEQAAPWPTGVDGGIPVDWPAIMARRLALIGKKYRGFTVQEGTRRLELDPGWRAEFERRVAANLTADEAAELAELQSVLDRRFDAMPGPSPEGGDDRCP